MTAPQPTYADVGRGVAANLTAVPMAPGRLSASELNLDALRQALPPTPDYVLRGLVRDGDLVALVSSAKAGKSLLTLDRVLEAVAAGRRVVYLDAENGFRDIHTRVHGLGYGTAPMTGLHYLSFPQLTLDVPAGAAELVAYIDELTAQHGRPDLVVLDTASRFISADENDSAGWLAMYRLALQPLKQRGCAVLRLDHLGKDTSRGARGSSAKSGDVDAIFELTADAPGPTDDRRVTLDCTHQRSGTYASHQVLIRGEIDGVLGHRHPGAMVGTQVVAEPHDEIARIVAALDATGAAPNLGRDRARAAVGQQFPDAVRRDWEEAVRRRKAMTSWADTAAASGAMHAS